MAGREISQIKIAHYNSSNVLQAEQVLTISSLRIEAQSENVLKQPTHITTLSGKKIPYEQKVRLYFNITFQASKEATEARAVFNNLITYHDTDHTTRLYPNWAGSDPDQTYYVNVVLQQEMMYALNYQMQSGVLIPSFFLVADEVLDSVPEDLEIS